MKKYEILVGYEDDLFLELNKYNNVIPYILDNDKFLIDFLLRNRDIIPKEFGGSADLNSNIFSIKMRRRWYCWFKKFIILKEALLIAKEDNYKCIIFCDADLVFKKEIPIDLIKNYQKYATFYHFGRIGRKRKDGFESGFIGFNLNNGGKEYLELTLEYYFSNKFRNYPRWDDSYIFWISYKENKINGIDLTPKATRGNVIAEGPFRKYIVHNKGSNNKYYESGTTSN